MRDDSFEAWNARLNARSPMVTRHRVWDGYPTKVTGSMLSFWGKSMRKRKRAALYRPRPAIERTQIQVTP